MDSLPDSRQLIVARERNEDFVANAAYIQSLAGIHEFSIKERDHVKSWNR
jgi:hypothetical protein